jgi:flagellar hook-associated protein 3 FlgL
MRMTFSAMQGSLDAINQAAEQFTRAQQQVASGKRVQAPSDDPTSMQRAIQDQAELGTLDAYSRASDTAASRLSVIDTVLGTMVDQLTDATATATGARGSTVDQVSRDAAVLKLAGIRDGLVGGLNTQFRGTYLFSGSRAQTPPYARVAGVWTYQGDAAPVSADIGRNRSVTLALDGQTIAKGSDTADLFAEFDALLTAVQAGDSTAIGTGIDALARAFNRTVQAQSQVGADERSVDDGQAQLSSLRLAGVARLAKDQDANLAEAITKMGQAQTAYQAALAAVGKANQSSLLDYLR